MTYVWHIAKLGDLMKFIIVLVSHRVRYNGIRCILRGFNKSLRTRTHARSAVKVYVQLAAVTATLFGQLLLYGQ